MVSRVAPSLTEALHGIALHECRRALRVVLDSEDHHRGVHEARKSLRRLKSLLRLGGRHFADALTDIEARIGRLATGLSPLRDAHVAVTTARKLADVDGGPDWKEALAALTLRSEGRLAAALGRDPHFAKRRQQLRELTHLVDALPWHAVDRSAIASALLRSERRVAKAHKQVRDQATPARLHRWRRRARRLRMQLELWRKTQKRMDATHEHHRDHDKALWKTMGELSDAIGAHQDLRALRDVVRSLVGPDIGAPLLKQIRTELARTKTTVRGEHPVHWTS